jgi:hypothetical protein
MKRALILILFSHFSGRARKGMTGLLPVCSERCVFRQYDESCDEVFSSADFPTLFIIRQKFGIKFSEAIFTDAVAEIRFGMR